MRRAVGAAALLVLLALAGCGSASRSAITGAWVRSAAARPVYIYVFKEGGSVYRSLADTSGSTETASYSETISGGRDVIRISGFSGGAVFATMASPSADVIDIQGVRYFRKGSAASRSNASSAALETPIKEDGKTVIYVPSYGQCTGACRLGSQ